MTSTIVTYCGSFSQIGIRALGWLSWLPTLSCYCDKCSLISDQSLFDLTCCIRNTLICLLHCLRLFYYINAGIS